MSRPAEGHGKKVGIMGGTFDPIHIGHLFCAEQALDAIGLDEAVFIPAYRPAFKLDDDVASFADRLEMCKLAVADNERFSVSDQEGKRGGVTYTIDTIEELLSDLGDDVSLHFILGADALKDLDKWKGAHRLSGLVEFICVSRFGADDLSDDLERLSSLGFKVEVVHAPLLDISSTEIRARIAEGRSIRYLTTDEVRRYIVDHRLYGENLSELDS